MRNIKYATYSNALQTIKYLINTNSNDLMSF